MTINEIDKALLGQYIDKFGAGLLNEKIKDLPENVKGQIYQDTKRHSPDTNLSELLADDSGGHDEVNNKDTWTVDEILKAELPELTWLVPDLIPVGFVSLAGRPKVGKSWLALQLAIAVASGNHFLGKKVEKSGVLYLALEDSIRRLQDRLIKLGVKDGISITFKTDYRPLDEAEGLNDFYAEVASSNYKLIIVDTFGRSLTAGKLEIKDYSDNVGILSKFQKITQKNPVTILLVDHHGKMSGDDPIRDLIGSIGKSATFDSIIGLYKEQNKQGAKLTVIGRDMDDVNLAIEFDPSTFSWQSKGDIKSVLQQTVLDAIKTLVNNGELATTTSIAEHIDQDRGNVHKAVSQLINMGKVKKLPKVDGKLQPFEAL